MAESGHDDEKMETLRDREEKADKSERQRISPPKLSMSTHDVDPRDVYQQLFGRKPLVDERSGQIVHTPANGFQPIVPDDRKR